MFNRRLISLSVTAGLILGLSGLAMAGIPDAGNSTVAGGGGTLMIAPNGNGETIASHSTTIDVHIADGNGLAIANFPAQDIWFDDAGTGDINLCQGGSTADADTDANGDTEISGTLTGGGWTKDGMSVFVSGVAITGGSGPIISTDVNSPDINGDRIVDLIDVGSFAADLLAYQFRSDLVFSGVIDLSDVGRFASFINASCP
jgi:hypothetical protein